jgi:hypothetical protein
MENLKKGGRPKLEKKRKIRKEMVFTEDEFELLNKRLSEGEYQNMNDMLRDILLNNQYKIITLDFDARIKKNILIEEVRRIGNNFNQLMKHLNQKKLHYFTVEDIAQLNKSILEIKSIYEKIEKNIRT